jgi:N-acetylneuraminic acid mutarotase
MKNLTKHLKSLVGVTLTLVGLLTVAALREPSALAQSSAAGWTLTGGLGTSRYGHTATLLPDGRVLVAGGTGSGGGVLSSAELYDPATGSWSATGSLNRGRYHHTATLLQNGKVLVAGGFATAETRFDLTDTVELYDPATGAWSVTGSHHTARYWHSATPLRNGKALVVGGLNDFDEGVALNSAELYDPTTGTWSSTGSLKVSRYLCTATPLSNGKVLVAGGVDGDFGTLYTVFKTAELYDPEAGTWSNTGGLSSGRFAHTATLLQNGNVLAAGGGAFPGFATVNNSAEVYNPATGTWSATGSLSRRSYHVATPLPNGKVLVAGGINYGFDIGFVATLNSVEIYDPASGAWSSTPDLNTARQSFTATPLRNGKVLVAGGSNNTGALNTAELYGAETDSNSIDGTEFFIRQHYLDFLGREPDAAGLAFWTNEITSCGDDTGCREVKRVNVSAAFFLSIEFQNTGYLVDRLYLVSYGRRPRLSEFLPDSLLISRDVVVNSPGWEQQLGQNEQAFADAWVIRPEFKAAYDAATDGQYVDSLFANAGVTPSREERDALVEGLGSGAETRSSALRKVAESRAVSEKEFDPAFVLMQYYGYLRRNPDDMPDGNMDGYAFWLAKLDQAGGDFVRAEMVKAFINSTEYRERFGRP